MIALLTPIAGAIFLALVRRRLVSALMQQHIVWWQFGCAALAAEVALSSTSLGRHQWVADWGSTIWVGALAVMIVVLARNALARSAAARGAWAVAAVGVLLNLVVVAANGGQMPQSQE